jgi:hypothetical protein
LPSSTGTKTLATDVANCEAEPSIRERKKIVEIPTHFLGLTAHCAAFGVLDWRSLNRKKPLLNRTSFCEP